MKGVYLRGKIFWLRYSVNGQRVFESAETPDRKTAELILKKRLVEIHEGKYFGKLKDIKTPLREAISQYLTVYAKERKSSWRADEIMLSKFLSYMGDGVFLQDIDRLAVDRFQTHLLNQKAEPGTTKRPISKPRVNRYLACLKTFFNRHIEWGNVKENPLKGVKLFQEEIRTRYLELGQIDELVNACSDALRPIVLTALLTGLRKSDILALRWDNIDFDNRLIHLNQKKTKTPIGINMSESLAGLFRDIPRNPDSPLVFHQGGKPLTLYGWVRGEFERAVKAAGLVNFKFHDLRHTFGTQQRFLGRDIAVIQELLGHRSIKMTMRYAHIRPAELKEAVDDLGQKIMEKIQKRDNDAARIGQIVEKASESAKGMWRNGRRKGLKNLSARDGENPAP